VKSAVPESMMAKKSAPVSKKPTYEANAEQAGAPSSGSF
jgi:hypothetical protein